MGFGHNYQTSPTQIEGEPPAYWQAQHAIMPGYGAFCRGNAPASRPSPQRGPVDPAMRDQNLHSLRVRVTQLEQNLRAAEKALTKKDRRIERLRQDAVDTGLENLKLNNFQDRALKAEAQRDASERRARDLEAENAQLVSENAGLRKEMTGLTTCNEHLWSQTRYYRLEAARLGQQLEEMQGSGSQSGAGCAREPNYEFIIRFNGKETEFARALKALFAKMYHSDAGQGRAEERKLRTETFKIFWSELQKVTKQAAS